MGADSLDNYLLKIIKDTTEYIEDNILEPLNLDCISEM
jgi:AraC family transcriptional regulator